MCLYLMGLNLSNHQIAYELDLNDMDIQEMASLLRRGVIEWRPRCVWKARWNVMKCM